MRIWNKRTDRNIPKTAVYVGRPTPWGNPFVIGRDGDRKTVIAKYRRWLWKRMQEGRIDRDRLAALAGKDLVCHCAPQPCHAQVLARAAKWERGQRNGRRNARRAAAETARRQRPL